MFRFCLISLLILGKLTCYARQGFLKTLLFWTKTNYNFFSTSANLLDLPCFNDEKCEKDFINSKCVNESCQCYSNEKEEDIIECHPKVTGIFTFFKIIFPWLIYRIAE